MLALPAPGRASEADRAWFESHGRRLDATLPTDLARSSRKVVDVMDSLQSFALSPDGRRALVAARGEIATVPLKLGRTIAVTRGDSGAHERDAAWSGDGSQVVFVSDALGEEALWIAPSDGSADPKPLTPQTTARHLEPSWSPDGKRIAVATSDQDVRVVDASTGDVRVVDRSEVWEIADLAWSPSGRYLAYSKPVEIDTAVVCIWDSRDGRVHEVTSRWTHAYAPAWDPKGRWLYLLSNRTVNPLIGSVDFETVLDRMTRPYALVLGKGDPGPFFPVEEELPEAEDGDGEGAEPAATKGSSSTAKDEPGRKAKRKGMKAEEEEKTPAIDFDGIADRLVAFPVDAGRYSDLRATDGAVLWMEHPSEGLLDEPELGEEPQAQGVLRAWKLEDREEAELASGIDSYDVKPDGARLLLHGADGLAWREGLDADDDGDEDLDVSEWTLAVDRREEWAQIYDEAWRLQREFYWDEAMGGTDWTALREQYGRLLPRVTTRDEVNDLVGQLIAELSTSHTYVWGGDLDGPDPAEGIGLLGADLEPDERCDCHRFVKVLEGRTWEPRSSAPLRLPQAGVEAGHYLLAINGRRLHADDDVAGALLGLDGDVVQLTVNERPTTKDARTVDVLAVGDDRRLRYLDWVEGRRREVDRLSGGRIGYLHIPDMGGEGLASFQEAFYPQLGKEALLVDARYNAGGFVSQLILARLQRRLLAFDRPRRGRAFTYPYRVFTGPLAVLTNGMTGSDGDIFAEAFQLAGLGPVIGTRTWGGVVGIRSDKPFVDGGMSTQPEFAWVDPRRGWDLENQGVRPDLVVENDPGSVASGRDLQLEAGVAHLLRKLEEEPPRRPQHPPAPDKTKARFRESQREYLGVP